MMSASSSSSSPSSSTVPRRSARPPRSNNSRRTASRLLLVWMPLTAFGVAFAFMWVTNWHAATQLEAQLEEYYAAAAAATHGAGGTGGGGGDHNAARNLWRGFWQQDGSLSSLDDGSPPRTHHRRRDGAKTKKKRRTAKALLPSSSKADTINHDASISPEFHIVFSTGCNVFQDWQSYGFFYHVMSSGQENVRVTRVASGCKEEEAAQLQAQHEEQISGPMSRHFHLHLTPDFATTAVPGETYKFFNKPFGIRHWMEHVLGFPDQEPPLTASGEEPIVVIMDPDMFLVRPFVRDYSYERELWMEEPGRYRKVAKGQPMGARYGFGGGWIRQLTNISDVLGSDTQPSSVRNWTAQYVDRYFSVGPPYLAVASDMYSIVKTWADFVVPIYHQTNKGFLAEMFAYSTAAVHLDLPHENSVTLMISDPDAGSRMEAWQWFDHEESPRVCNRDIQRIPHVLHYCQRYFLGNFFFSKYQLPKTPPDELFLSCEHPLFVEPGLHFADEYDWAISLDSQRHEFVEGKAVQRIRMAFFLCQLLTRLNEMATFYKQQNCPAQVTTRNGEDGELVTKLVPANFSKVFMFETHADKDKRKQLEKKTKKNPHLGNGGMH